MNFRTEVQIKKGKLEIDHQTKMMMLGSCFTDSIGERLLENKFNANINPFGTLYNPSSIKDAVLNLRHYSPFGEEDIFFHNALYHSFSHHGDFSNVEKDEILKEINESLQSACTYFNETDILFITFGTAYVYEHVESESIVANCHKLPASKFKRYKLSVEHIVVEWTELITELQSRKPNLKIVFTVSPIRHLRDGAHDNQLSKATLLLAVDELCRNFENTLYFPSYEIVLDDLRDYRFYNADMVHPSSLAIEYIWDILKNGYLSEQSINIIAEWKSLKQALSHRPINEDSEPHREFLKQTLLKLKLFANKYHYICLDNEMTALSNKINN